MIKIFKYPIPVTDYFNMPIDNYFKIEMPLHAEILCLKMVKEKPYIWALIDDTKELKDTSEIVSEKLKSVYNEIDKLKETVSSSTEDKLQDKLKNE